MSFGVLAGVGPAKPGASSKAPRDRRIRSLNVFKTLVSRRKGLELNQDFNTSTSVLPMRAGDGDTLMPADSIAAIFDSASPLPPEMIEIGRASCRERV